MLSFNFPSLDGYYYFYPRNLVFRDLNGAVARHSQCFHLKSSFNISFPIRNPYTNINARNTQPPDVATGEFVYMVFVVLTVLLMHDEHNDVE